MSYCIRSLIEKKFTEDEATKNVDGDSLNYLKNYLSATVEALNLKKKISKRSFIFERQEKLASRLYKVGKAFQKKT